MNTAEIINQLKNSKLEAECPCGHNFKLSEITLFDGTKPFPTEAIEAQKKLIEDLKNRKLDLEKQKKLATKKAEITTTSVNIGKSLEKVLPMLNDFKWQLPDCRFLGSPIDLITFNGLSNNKITSLNFIEIKTGNSNLNKHQKAVRDAVIDKKVTYQVIK